ncbi:MAG: hypothetical protein LUE23_11525 [Lachnospiraceae bacterium]|nr:hypothetical protein [Lachnospiraceae bacterium]
MTALLIVAAGVWCVAEICRSINIIFWMTGIVSEPMEINGFYYSLGALLVLAISINAMIKYMAPKDDD